MATISSQSTRTAGAVSRYAQKAPVAVSAVNASVPMFERELAAIRARHGKDGVRPKVLMDDKGKVVHDEDGNPVVVKDSHGSTVYEARYVQAYSLVQSYGYDELDPDDPESWARAQELGRALIEDRFPGHPALIATEVNGRSGCVHNHLIVGAVHPVTGKSIDSNVVTHSRLAIQHDRVLAEHGFFQREDMQEITADAAQRIAGARARTLARMPEHLSENQRCRRLVAAENSVKLHSSAGRSVVQEREDKRLREHGRYMLNEQTREAARSIGIEPPAERFSEIVLETRITAALNDPRSRSWDELAEVGRLNGVAISRRGHDVSYGMMLEQPDGSLAGPARAHIRRGGIEGSGKGLGPGFRRADVEAAIERNTRLQLVEEHREEYADAALTVQRWRESGEFEDAFERLRTEATAEPTTPSEAQPEPAEPAPFRRRRFQTAAQARPEPAYQSRLRTLKSKSPVMQERLNALAPFEEHWHGRLPSSAQERIDFEEQASRIGIGRAVLKGTEPYMYPELYGYLSLRADHAEHGSAAVDRRKILEERLPGLERQAKADPFNARGTTDRLREARADLKFETGYIQRVREDHAAGIYDSREHERAEHVKKQVAARAARLEPTEAQKRLAEDGDRLADDRSANQGRRQSQDIGIERD